MAKKSSKRYFGIVKLKEGQKVAWISREDKNGFSLGLALNSRTVWIKGIRLSNPKEVERALKSTLIYVLVKGSKYSKCKNK